GAMIGAVIFSTVFMSALGTGRSQQLLMLISVLSGLWILAPAAFRRSAVLPSVVAILSVVCATGLALVLVRSVPPTPGELIAHGRSMLTNADSGVILFQGEGLNSSVAVNMMHDGSRGFHVSGKAEASSTPQDMRVQRMLGHLPALLHPK